jgi:flagellar hook protein FlgE
MMRSLYSAISGLRNHQVKMDVIGNNIANVNTTGFKRSRVNFATALSQTMNGASAPTAGGLGGTNPMQVGLGASIGSIDQIMTQGSAQTTGNVTDMMIQDAGFFVLDNNGTVYSRAGAFILDSEGGLVDAGTGARVQGIMFDAADAVAKPPTATIASATSLVPIQIAIGSVIGDPTTQASSTEPGLDSYSIDQKGVITGVYVTPADPTTTPPTAAVTTSAKIGQIAIATFANDAGLQNVGDNFYIETNNSGIPVVDEAGSIGHGTIVPNALEMSNVDLSQEFTDMIVAQRGFQANSRVITVSDTLLQELIDLKRN